MCKLVEYKNGRQVAEIKYNHIMNVADQARSCPNINRIMLFGSSLEERCTSRSDIDIAVFGDKPKGSYIDSKEFRMFKNSVFKFDWDQDYDILYFSENGNNKGDIMRDISKGLEIYRRAEQ